jgi:probable HAF family extracellular repeat protein
MRRVSLLVVLVVCIAGSIASAAAPPTVYAIKILSGAGAAGNSIDDFGLVAGSYTLASGAVHASVWAFGRQLDLHTLGSDAGLGSTVLWPVKNHLGLVSGISQTDRLDPNKELWSCGYFLANPDFHTCLGFLWDPASERMRALPTLGGNNGFATGTNDFSQTVGWAENTVHDSSCVSPQVLQFRPVVWGPERDQIRALPLIAGDSAGAATAINDRGQIVGISGACGIAVGSVTARHAVLWENGRAEVLVNPNGAPYWNTPMMISERGDIVGFAGVPGDAAGALTPAFLWTREDGWQFLPMLSGDIASAATSINSRRQIVGYSNNSAGELHPWIWEHGKLTNLNQLIAPGSGLSAAITLALDINERGEITGTTASGQAFIAIPISN